MHAVAGEREVDVVGREEFFLQRAVRVGEIVRQVEHVDFRVAVQLQQIERRVGLLDVVVEPVAGGMSGQNLRDDHFRLRELVAHIGHAHLDALGGRLDARFRCEEHVIVADHDHHHARFETFDAAVVQTPQHVLRLVPADADVDGLVAAEVVLPGLVEHALVQRTAPLLRDAVADQQYIDGALIGPDVCCQLRVRIQPTGSAPMPCRRRHRPQRGFVLGGFPAGPAFILWFQDVSPLRVGQRPARQLRVHLAFVVRGVGIFQTSGRRCGPDGQGKRCQEESGQNLAHGGHPLCSVA